MPRFFCGNTEALKAALGTYLGKDVGTTLSAIQIWYEALGGYGIPLPEDYEAIEKALLETGEWEEIGDVRHEKFGVQKTFRSKKPYVQKDDEPLRIQHVFGLNTFWKTPEGKTIKIVTSEVYRMRAFEIIDGKFEGPMLRIDPKSDYAKQLVPAV